MADFTQYEEDSQIEITSDDKLALLAKLGQELLRRKAAVAAAQEALVNANNAVADLTERTIPALMNEMGLASFRLSSGQEIAVNEVVSASISEARRDAAHAWLEENGLADIIKRKVIVAFNREQEAEANKLIRNLAKYKNPMNVLVEKKVEPQTLKKTVRELLEQGDLSDDALALLGVFKKKVADVGTKAKKSSSSAAAASDNPF